jgi:hypothetical protein
MDLMLLRVFQAQVEFQLRALLNAHARLMAALGRLDTAEVWFSVENLLSAAANVSKAFWGQGPAANAARKPLRDSLAIRDGSPFSERRMRNHFEHYDERLDEWWAKSPSHNIADKNVMPVGAFVGIDKLDMFRQLDPTTLDVVFWGDTFNIPEIVAEASRILPIVAREAAKRHWVP